MWFVKQELTLLVTWKLFGHLFNQTSAKQFQLLQQVLRNILYYIYGRRVSRFEEQYKKLETISIIIFSLILFEEWTPKERPVRRRDDIYYNLSLYMLEYSFSFWSKYFEWVKNLIKPIIPNTKKFDFNEFWVSNCKETIHIFKINEL